VKGVFSQEHVCVHYPLLVRVILLGLLSYLPSAFGVYRACQLLTLDLLICLQ
jgi:hypothetical protein